MQCVSLISSYDPPKVIAGRLIHSRLSTHKYPNHTLLIPPSRRPIQGPHSNSKHPVGSCEVPSAPSHAPEAFRYNSVASPSTHHPFFKSRIPDLGMMSSLRLLCPTQALFRLAPSQPQPCPLQPTNYVTTIDFFRPHSLASLLCRPSLVPSLRLMRLSILARILTGLRLISPGVCDPLRNHFTHLCHHF